MKNIKSFQNYSRKKNEAWNSFLGGPKTEDAAHDALRGQRNFHTGTDDLHGKNTENFWRDKLTNYIEFGGRKFYNQDLLFASYDDMGEIPRIEGDKLIIANPAWSE